MRIRFGLLDAATLARIESANVEALNRYTDRVMIAASVDEVLAP